MNAQDYRASHRTGHYGEIYDRTYAGGYYYYQWTLLEEPILRHLFRELAARGEATCLDFACGTGRITRVAEEYFGVTGVDVSATMLEQARRHVERAELRLQDITREPLQRRFDVCTAFRFFLNAQEQLRHEALDAIYSHLKTGGTLIANIHVNSRSILGLAYRLRNQARRRKVANVVQHDDFCGLLEESGFRVEQTLWYSYLPRVGWTAPWLAKHAMLPVEKACRYLPRWARGWSQAFIVIARKHRD